MLVMKKMDINEIAETILLSPKKRKRELCREILEDVDYFDNVSGVLSEANARALLQQGTGEKTVAELLTWIFEFCDENTISDEVFRGICRYRRKTRYSIFVTISHRKLSFYQLSYINNHADCLEAFAALLCAYATNPCFTVSDLRMLVEKRPKGLLGINLDEMLREESVPQEKADYLRSC